jgi:hypothetical protein
LREDWIYTNDVGSHISLKRHEGFFTFSEQARKKFGQNYKFISNGTLVTSQQGKKLNLDEVLTMLKSKDESLFNNMQYIFDNEFRFLDGKPLKTKIAFCTFPRSGNSLMRRLLETATGIATGSTGSLNTGTYLQFNGLKGQYVMDERVWITKAHHPSLQPGILNFASDKVLCVVRNPLDSIISFATLANTMSHSAEVEYEYHLAYPEWWDWWVRYLADL